MISKEDIELFCKLKGVKYISHKQNDDGFCIDLTIEVVRRMSPHDIMPYIDQEKLKK